MSRIATALEFPGVRRRSARGLAHVAMGSLLALFLAACSSTEESDIVPEQPVEQLYNDAVDQLMADDYKKAATLFDEVERQHPYSVWATKGQLMSAFAHYRNAEYPEAVVTLDHFIELHPAHENVDYAYYLRALCYYERITDVSRDQQVTERARDSLEELVGRFPNSRYAADSKPKLVLVRDQLAGKEMEIGRYYQTRGNYLAAINRFRTVVTKFETTSHVPEALHRLTELYMSLGVMDAAQEYAAVLGYNFPGSDWYEDSYDLLIHRGRVPPAPPAAAEAAPAAQPAAYKPATPAQSQAAPSGAPPQASAPAAAPPSYTYAPTYAPSYYTPPGGYGPQGMYEQSVYGAQPQPAPAPPAAAVPPPPAIPQATVQPVPVQPVPVQPAPGSTATPPATDAWGGALPQSGPGAATGSPNPGN